MRKEAVLKIFKDLNIDDERISRDKWIQEGCTLFSTARALADDDCLQAKFNSNGGFEFKYGG